MEDFSPAAVGPAEDLLVDFPSRLGDVRPPFSELGVLQVAVHFIFLPQKCFSRSVLLPSSGRVSNIPTVFKLLQPLLRLLESSGVFAGPANGQPLLRSPCFAERRAYGGGRQHFLRGQQVKFARSERVAISQAEKPAAQGREKSLALPM
jgi:hypothetical protein